MKQTKLVLIAFMMLMIIALLPTNNVHAEGALPDQLVVLPTGDYNVKEAKAMMERLEKIPAPILKTLADKGVKVKLTNDIITNEPELNYLKGVTPRGWEGTGLTWDDVPGVSEKVVVVRIGYSKKGHGHNSYNLEIHETLHAVDRFVFNNASDSQDFKDIFTKEAASNYHDGYVSAYPAEYFAESASLYLYNDTTRKELKKNAPLTYDFMDKLFNQ
ncbi:hypothetical protein ACFQZR_01075 [Paenibacillus sp. GCM10027629]|uniref:anthrax toxin lethal factor-related metalloendopeptidase n=1 Tax=Paenibacillus sp. GCM10027629 TaxID=3273414 RepID=UPI00362E5B0B